MNGNGLPPVKRWRVTIKMDVHDGEDLLDRLLLLIREAVKCNQRGKPPPGFMSVGSVKMDIEENQGYVSRETYPDELAEWWKDTRKPGTM